MKLHAILMTAIAALALMPSAISDPPNPQNPPYSGYNCVGYASGAGNPPPTSWVNHTEPAPGMHQAAEYNALQKYWALETVPCSQLAYAMACLEPAMNYCLASVAGLVQPLFMVYNNASVVHITNAPNPVHAETIAICTFMTDFWGPGPWSLAPPGSITPPPGCVMSYSAPPPPPPPHTPNPPPPVPPPM